MIGEDVHPYLRQLEQALELEIKYRVPIGDNPAGEMSGGITSGMRDGSAHVLRCLKVKFQRVVYVGRVYSKLKFEKKCDLRKPYCLSRRPKSTFFDTFYNGAALKGPAE